MLLYIYLNHYLNHYFNQQYVSLYKELNYNNKPTTSFIPGFFA